MTKYEQGFLTKCAEYGLNANVATSLMKFAQSAAATTGGTRQQSINPDNFRWYGTAALGALGAGYGALAAGRKRRLRGLLMGLLAGLPLGYVGGDLLGANSQLKGLLQDYDSALRFEQTHRTMTPHEREARARARTGDFVRGVSPNSNKKKSAPSVPSETPPSSGVTPAKPSAPSKTPTKPPATVPRSEILDRLLLDDPRIDPDFKQQILSNYKKTKYGPNRPTATTEVLGQPLRLR